MAHTTLKMYFESLACLPSLTEDGKVQAGTAILHCEHQVKALLKQQTLTIGVTSDLQPLISTLRRKLNFDLEEQLKSERLKETIRMEKDLKMKLESMQEQIQSLSPTLDPPKPQKIKINREIREKVRDLEEEKTKEVKSKLEKMREEQKLRDLQRKKQLEKIEMEEKLEKEEKNRLILERISLREREKQHRIDEMRSLSLRRHEHMAEMQQILKTNKVPRLTLSSTPQISHNHSKERINLKEMIETHKEKYREIQRNREAKRFEELLGEKLKGNSNSMEYHYFFDVERERKAMQKAAKQQSLLREELKNKKKRYATLVKEMYKPVIDLKKQQEIEQLKEKIHTVPRSTRPIDRTARPHSLSHTDSINSEQHRRKKAKSVQLEEEKKPVRPMNYLVVLRKKRLAAEGNSRSMLEPLDPSPADTPKGVLEKANRLEQRALHEARKWRHSDPMDLDMLEKVQGADAALLSSVKAKLSLLPL